MLAAENLDVALREAIENGIVHQDTDAPTVVVSVSTPSEDMARVEIRNQGSFPDVEREALETGTGAFERARPLAGQMDRRERPWVNRSFGLERRRGTPSDRIIPDSLVGEAVTRRSDASADEIQISAPSKG